MRMRLFVLILACLFAVSPALAQEREPAQRQTLIDLAYVLGEAHALRQLCAGTVDQFWRMRMLKMLEAEASDRVFEQRLRETFNIGYVARQAEHTSCTAQSREAETKVAANGKALAARLAAPPQLQKPDSLAPR